MLTNLAGTSANIRAGCCLHPESRSVKIHIGGDDMKKNFAVIRSICVFTVSFLSFWFADDLFNRLFVLGLLPLVVSVLYLLGSLIVSMVAIIRKPSVLKNYLPFVISLISIIVLLNFPFRNAKVKLELKLYDKGRTRIVEMVKSGDIISNDWGNAELPDRFDHLSSDGNIFIYQNDDEQVISFWVFRGMLSGSVQLIYSSKDENLIFENETEHSIVSIEKLKEHWYLVETDY